MTSCYLCGATELRPVPGQVRDAPGLPILECAACGLVFLGPQAEIAPEFYAAGGMNQAITADFANWRRHTAEDDRLRFERIRARLANQDVLDFGCGNGGFIERAAEVARSVQGVELDVRAQEYGAAKGYRVFADLDACVAAGNSYDLVTMFHVLEHIADPRAMLRALATLLRPGGELVVEVPHARDALAGLYGCEAFRRFTYWSCHLFLFDAHTLATLVEQAGLRCTWVQHVQRYPLANHLHWLAKGLPGGHKNWHFLASPALDQAYADTLAGLGLTDTLVAGIARA